MLPDNIIIPISLSLTLISKQLPYITISLSLSVSRILSHTQRRAITRRRRRRRSRSRIEEERFFVETRSIVRENMAYEEVINGLNLKDTELRLGLPGTEEQQEQDHSCVRSNKRKNNDLKEESLPPPKTQIVGWPPVRSSRKNNKNVSYVKVSMDGAPYLRKIDLKMYKNYLELLKALENLFKFTIGEYSEREGYKKGSGFVPTYEDKDGDWMLVGDVPWDMFSSSCQKLRIMKRSEAPSES